MVYKRFSILILVRIGLLLASMIILARVSGIPDRLFTKIMLLLTIIIQIYELIYYVNKTNRSLSFFLDTLKDKNFSSGSNIELVDESFKSLNQSFKDIARTISDSKLEKEVQFQLLNLIVNKIQTGILLFQKQSEKIRLINKEAIQLLKLKSYKNLDDLKTQIPELKIISNSDKFRKEIIETKIESKTQQFLIHISPVKLLTDQYTLITFNNIQEELDKKEVQSWQQILRTLSHEIMNSVTPIISLTETSLMQVQNESGQLKNISELKEKSLSKIQKALKTIEKRSSGLYQFVDDFRKIAKIPEPNKEAFKIHDLFQSVSNLMLDKLSKNSVNLTSQIDSENMELNADFALIEQVLINLILNAQEASADNIQLNASQQNKNIIIEVKDNGTGIPEQKINEIFVPFFTSKEKGSGIGLSLSRQIMHLHGGNIFVRSEPGKETVFTLQF